MTEKDMLLFLEARISESRKFLSDMSAPQNVLRVLRRIALQTGDFEQVKEIKADMDARQPAITRVWREVAELEKMHYYLKHDSTNKWADEARSWVDQRIENGK